MTSIIIGNLPWRLVVGKLRKCFKGRKIFSPVVLHVHFLASRLGGEEVAGPSPMGTQSIVTQIIPIKLPIFKKLKYCRHNVQSLNFFFKLEKVHFFWGQYVDLKTNFWTIILIRLVNILYLIFLLWTFFVKPCLLKITRNRTTALQGQLSMLVCYNPNVFACRRQCRRCQQQHSSHHGNHNTLSFSLKKQQQSTKELKKTTYSIIVYKWKTFQESFHKTLLLDNTKEQL